MNIFETTGCMTKINSQFPFTEKLKEFSMNPKWQDRYSMWDFVSASSEDIGQILYEHGKNFVQNVRDIDTCSIHALHSMAQEMDLEYVFNYDLIYPAPLEKLMDLLSTNRSYLLTTGYLLKEDCLDYLYNKYGVDLNKNTVLLNVGVTDENIQSNTNPVTGLTLEDIIEPVTGLSIEHATNISDYAKYSIYIPDEDYIEYMESLLTQHFKEYTSYYPRTNLIPTYDEDCNIIYPDNEDTDYYQTESIRENAFKISQEYIGFLDSITHNPELEWNSETSAGIVEEGVHILRNICIKTSYYRDILKDTIQRYAMIGSTRAIEKLMYEYILRNMTEQTAWRYWVAPIGTSESLDEANELNTVLPNISNMDEHFNIQVVEYWDYTEYMNISAASPYVCGIVGYDTVSETVSSIDTSGYIVTSIDEYEVPIWDDTGLCGLVVEGGNERYWEGKTKDTYISYSENSPAEVSGFYREVGVEGNSLQDYCDFQAYLFDTFAVSGLDRLSIYPELCGVSLVDIHKKYIGNISGDIPPANIKNQEYPTMAPQPFIWNLVEKIPNIFMNLDSRLLFTASPGNDYIPDMVDAFGNLIDSWKFPNHEYMGYNTYYEESHNNDWDYKENKDIDRDGSFHPDALSAYLIDSSPENMAQYYTQLGPDFQLSASVPRIDWQLEGYYDNIVGLKDYEIAQYAWDGEDNHYMLYKDIRNPVYEMPGRIYMRYRNHPIPFPLVIDKNIDSPSLVGQKNNCGRYVSQLYTYNLMGINKVINNCHEFGFDGSLLWMQGVDKTMITKVGYIDFPPPLNERQFSIIIDEKNVPQTIYKSYMSYIGTYRDYGNLIFLYYNGYDSENKTIQLEFYYYNVYDNKLLNDSVILNIKTDYAPYKWDDHNFNENIFKLASNNKSLSIAYEAYNSDKLHTGYDNSIVTVDIINISNEIYNIKEWKNIQEPYR